MKIFSKLTFVAAILAGFSLFGSAQDASWDSTKRPNVLVDEFTWAYEVGEANAKSIRNFVIQGLDDSNRVDVIDITTTNILALEAERRNNGASADGDMERLKVMQQQGANALIQGEITGLKVNSGTTKDGKRYYDAILNFTIKAIDPNTGKIYATESYTHGGEELFNTTKADTYDGTVANVCKRVVGDMRSYAVWAFPIRGSILEVNEVKKDEINSVYISVGSTAGVSKGTKFTIYVTREIAGRSSRTKIGELQVEAVEGGDISLAKVKKGKKELKQALDSGQTIRLIG